jgi:hypothetical protein
LIHLNSPRRLVPALGGESVEIVAGNPEVPLNVAEFVAAIIQFAESRALGTQLRPPRAEPAEHPGPSATHCYGHGRLLGFAHRSKSQARALI